MANEAKNTDKDAKAFSKEKLMSKEGGARNRYVVALFLFLVLFLLAISAYFFLKSSGYELTVVEAFKESCGCLNF